MRRHGQFDACEDAVQEALLAASQQWPDEFPDNPRSWLVAVANRRLVDEWRSESARRRREEEAFNLETDSEAVDQDDTLTLLYMCCHPALSPPSQLALTLRAVGGLTTAEIASAFLVPEATMAQRISRAKQTIKKAGARFEPPADTAQRLGVVLHVLYLVFNEGYATSAGPQLNRTDLTSEAIRIARLLNSLIRDGEARGLLALMLLTDARRAARAAPDGALVPLAEQDRSLWDTTQIEEGLALVAQTLGKFPIGPYQVQAAIAALHDEAATAAATDWPQILALYTVLTEIAPSPVVTLNKSVAVAMVHGPAAGLETLAAVDLPKSHRVPAVRAHLLEMAGDTKAAAAAYREAARMTASRPEQHYLTLQAARLSE